VSFGYDALSRIVTSTDGKGQASQTSYDALDRIVRIVYADGSSVDFTYDANGNLRTQTDSIGTKTIDYDALNRVVSETLPGGSVITYGYDPVGNLTSLTDGGGTVTYGYNQVNLLTSVREPGQLRTTLTYDPSYRRKTVRYPNGVTMKMNYDFTGRLTKVAGVDGAGVPLTSFSYSYTDPVGRDSDLRQSVTDLDGNTTTYSYDVANRLVDATTRNPAAAVVARYQYAYDGNGNLLQRTVDGATTTYQYNSANQLVSGGGTSYTYDANGNLLTSSAGFAASYNAKDQTTSITPPGGATVTMAYAGPGQQELVSAGGRTFTNNLLGLGTESDGAGVTYHTRDSGGTLLGSRTPAGGRYYLTDGVGSVVAVTDGAGNVLKRYQYDPFGSVTSQSGTLENPWRFAGTYFDSRTSLHKMGARFYDPATSRWTQRDPLFSTDPTGLNGYAYAANNPVNFVDPEGLSWYYYRGGVSYSGYLAGTVWWRGAFIIWVAPLAAWYGTFVFHVTGYATRYRATCRGCWTSQTYLPIFGRWSYPFVQIVFIPAQTSKLPIPKTFAWQIWIWVGD
jgi:RHS repeat-associated protein